MPSIAMRSEGLAAPALRFDALAATPTALLADAHRDVVGFGEPMRNHGGRTHFVGEALTIHVGSLAQWKALDLARAGQVLVIASGSRRDRAEFGAVFVKLAARKGIAIVTDGLLRDRDEIARLDIAVFACGSHPASPADPQQGRIGFPEQLAGATVANGDILVGDSDGLVLISRGAFDAVLARLEQQRQREQALEDGGTGRDVQLPARILDAVRAVPLVD